MKTNLNFEDKETKILLSKLDFEYFLKRNIQDEKYDENSVKKIYLKYSSTTGELKKLDKGSKWNNLQLRYYLEGQVRKMFSGGFLPAILQLNDSKKVSLFDFDGVGESWAYFDLWRKLYKRKLLLDNTWEIIIKTGSLLGIVLSIIKLIEVIHNK